VGEFTAGQELNKRKHALPVLGSMSTDLAFIMVSPVKRRRGEVKGRGEGGEWERK
jgi:hypothetical protein